MFVNQVCNPFLNANDVLVIHYHWTTNTVLSCNCCASSKVPHPSGMGCFRWDTIWIEDTKHDYQPGAPFLTNESWLNGGFETVVDIFHRDLFLVEQQPARLPSECIIKHLIGHHGDSVVVTTAAMATTHFWQHYCFFARIQWLLKCRIKQQNNKHATW